MNLSLLLSSLQFSPISNFLNSATTINAFSLLDGTLISNGVLSNSTMVPPPLLDVLIIGGGPAGLSAATGLARQLYTAVVFDSGVYRNALAKYMHNVLTWDHQDPNEFRKKGRDDILKRYSTISFQDTEIKSVAKTTQGLFEAKDAAGKVWTGRKLVLATGITDVFPDINGYASCWAKGMYVFSPPAGDRSSASVRSSHEVNNAPPDSTVSSATATRKGTSLRPA